MRFRGETVKQGHPFLSWYDCLQAAGRTQARGVLVSFLDSALVIMIAMELFRTVMAYITREKVVLAVLEASLVAVAREIILIGREADALKTISMAVLPVAVFGTYLASYRRLKGWERAPLYG
ncbi:MAG: hypothetical protein MAG715_00925 [Methanonatronarchaeales archaeon]|nr:hypothetical protein [Methanonatronarchaeales archaeon]